MYTGTIRTPLPTTPKPDIPTIRFLPFWIVRPKALVLAAETGLLAACLVGATVAALRSPGNAEHSLAVVLGLAGGQTLLLLTGVNRSLHDLIPSAFLRGILASLLTGCFLSTALSVAYPAHSTTYAEGLAAWSLAAAFVALFRPVVRTLVRNRRLIQTLMILGPHTMAEKLYRELAGREDAVPAPTDSDGLEPSMSQECVSRIVIADPRMSAHRHLSALIDSRMRGLKIEQAVESCERMCRKIWLEGLQPEWWIYSNGFIPTRFCIFLKHSLDLVGGVVLLLLLWPLFLLTAIAIKLSSKGPVFYRQERVGLHGETFMALKFRSMRVDAEAQSGPQWSTLNDSRITPLGATLRQFRIDELPQLFNVLKGEMSFIGPRPERPHFVALLKRDIPYYDVRHYIRPGITGWAQVKYPYGASVRDAYQKLQYDLYYAKHISLFLDAIIVFKTLKVVLAGRGR